MSGKIQNEDIKSAAELAGGGGSASQLPNDDKIYVTALSINKTLKQALIDGNIATSGGVFNYTAQTSAYSAAARDFVNCTSGTFAVTLPTAASIAGFPIKIKNSGSGVITLNTTSSQTIDGYASGYIDLSNQYEEITVISDGSNWMIDGYKFKKSSAIFSTGNATANTSRSSNGFVRINNTATVYGGADITATQDGTDGCKFVTLYDGWVTIFAMVDKDGGNDIQIYKNGSLFENSTSNINSGTVTTHSVITMPIQCTKNDYFQIYTSSSTVDTVTSLTTIGALLEKEL